MFAVGVKFKALIILELNMSSCTSIQSYMSHSDVKTHIGAGGPAKMDASSLNFSILESNHGGYETFACSVNHLLLS